MYFRVVRLAFTSRTQFPHHLYLHSLLEHLTSLLRGKLVEHCVVYSFGILDAVNGLHRNACSYQIGTDHVHSRRRMRCTVIPQASHTESSRMQGVSALDDSRCSREMKRYVKQNRCWCCNSVIEK
jgi:hypothetical protein